MIILNPNWLPHQTETEITYLGKLISDIFWVTDRRHDPRYGIWRNPVGLFIPSSCNSIYPKVEEWNQKQNACWHQMRMRENGSGINFSFVSLPCPMPDENWASLLCCSSSENAVLIILTFCKQKFWLFPLSHITALLFVVFNAWLCPSCFPHQLWHCQSCVLYSGVPFLCNCCLLNPTGKGGLHPVISRRIL